MKLIPPEIGTDNPSAAEKFIFNAFKNSRMNENFVVLHSVGLLKHERKRRWAELDFLIVSPRGLLVLEVKGGGVERDEKGYWHTNDRFGEKHELTHSPFEQASSGLHAVMGWLERNGIPNFSQKYVAGFAVLFPDTEKPARGASVFGAEAGEEIVYWDDDKVNDISDFISGAYKHFIDRDKRAKPLDVNIASKVVELLRGVINIQPSPAWKRKNVDAQQITFTEEQWTTLSLSKNQPRLLIHGSAGTGKTVLASNMAKEFSGNGTVLFLCFNKALAKKLKEINTEYQNIRVSTLHSLAYSMIQESAHATYLRNRRSDFGSDNLLALFADALLDSQFKQFDYIVVDEGQDILNSGALDILDLLLRGGLEKGKWVWFMDLNFQAAVFGNYEGPAHNRLKLAATRTNSLDLNCRNTHQIVRLLEQSFPSAQHSLARVEGEQININTLGPEDLKLRLEKEIKRLLKQGMTIDDIVILSPLTNSKSALKKDLLKDEEGHFFATSNHGDVRYHTISAFKGLESPAVILVDAYKLDDDWWESVMYVGLTRSTYSITIFASPEFISDYDTRRADG